MNGFCFGNKVSMAVKTNIALVPLEGDLNVVRVPQLRRTIDALIDAGCQRIIINMAEVQHIDSAGMALLFCEMRRMRSRGGLLSLKSVSRGVYHALSLARVIDMIPISLIGKHASIPALDPSARPIWQSSMLVSAEELSKARQWTTHMLERMYISADDVFDMTLAAGEALGNAIDHSCCEDCVYISLAAYPDRVVIEVSDTGCGYSIDETSTPVSRTGSDQERGRGIKLMRLLVDSVSIKKKKNSSGTLVRLVKLLRSCKL